MTPTREDFARWRDDPVTRFILAAHSRTAERNKDAWISQSWDNGQANPITLVRLRTYADAYMAIAEMTYEDVCEANGEQPREE